MCEFRVGQRVKKVRRCDAFNSSGGIPLGAEGRVSSLCNIPPGTKWACGSFTNEHLDVVVDFCEFGKFSTASYTIEPIIPEGAAPSEYSYTELMDRCRAGEGVPA